MGRMVGVKITKSGLNSRHGKVPVIRTSKLSS